MAIDFKKFAEDVARRGEVEALLPIVEKELIHYDIIRALDESAMARRPHVPRRNMPASVLWRCPL